ncbi:MAG: response regulator [Pseudomonadota bacterium]
MTENALRRKSLRAMLLGQFSVITLLVVALCGFLVFVSLQNRQSIENQQRVNSAYLGALELDEIIDDLIYYGAELSNSLSDESYDSFLKASERADDYIEEIDDPKLRVQLRRHKEMIVDSAIKALDAYVVDDRQIGDGHMATLRSAAGRLDAIVETHVSAYQDQRLAEEMAILNRNNLVQTASIAAATITVAVIILLVIHMWRNLFRPIGTLIESISNAASAPEDAASQKILALANNEVGLAGAALNTLLDSVTSSISEAQLRANDAQKLEARWKALFDESPDAIVLLDPKTTELLERNPASEKLLCMDVDAMSALESMTALELHRHEVKELKSFLSQVMTDGCARNDALSCGIEDRRIPVSVVGVAVPHENDRAILLHIRDISAQREYEQELQEAREEAVRAAESKSNFLANMSHEIRTPMNGIMGMAEVLANTELTPKQENFVNIINKSSDALLTIINDILDFSKIDSGQMSFDNEPFNLKTVVEDVIGLIATRADEKDIELIIRYQPKLAEEFVGDDGRMRQVLMNLIGNAVKFTEKGHVLVDISGEELEDRARLKVRIEDTGIGIPQDKLDAIFEKFNQVDNSATRKFEGTGLGLAICRMLIEKMDGEIGVESTVGAGSAFWFDISLPISEKRAPKKVFPVDVRDTRVLIVDDNAVNREILLEQISNWGLVPTACDSAGSAFEALEAATAQDSPFELIIMDYQMPEIDGVEAYERISADFGTASAPCILLTSVSDDDNRSRVRAAGIKASLTKPARSSELFNTIITVLSEHGIASLKKVAGSNETPKQKSEAVSTSGRKRIVVAEDNEVNQAVIGELLTSLGYDYILAEDGRQAVEKVKLYAPDIVLMDVSMPVMNGLEATAAIKALDAGQGGGAIIIGLTANALAGDREKCLDAGMDDYLPKPVNRQSLGRCISKWFATLDVDIAGESVA